jgi:UDP-4-amino-4,6-dideoxy-N-acetyl-beta-L-altrosamine transaminase
MISYGKQSLNDDDFGAVADVLANQNLTQGQQVPAFEQALCDYTGAKYAVAVNSGTSALHIACLAAGVSQGDIVYTTPNTFVASANCALYCGAQIDFVDICPKTRQLNFEQLENKLIKANQSNTLPKALILVHFAGHACDMQKAYALSQKYGFVIIEDNAHGLGGQYQGQYRLGKPAHSSFTACSFHPVKSITTCEGGAVLTDNPEHAKTLRMYASHGITKDKTHFLCEPFGASHFEQQHLGFNYRLSDVHAALGRSQLKRIDTFIEARFQRAKRYHEALSKLPVMLPELDSFSAWHLYVIELLEHDQVEVCQTLWQHGIGVNVHYIPVHWHPYFQQLGFKQGQFPNSEVYYKRAMTLPLFPTLTADEQEHVITVLTECLS